MKTVIATRSQGRFTRWLAQLDGLLFNLFGSADLTGWTVPPPVRPLERLAGLGGMYALRHDQSGRAYIVTALR